MPRAKVDDFADNKSASYFFLSNKENFVHQSLLMAISTKITSNDDK